MSGPVRALLAEGLERGFFGGAAAIAAGEDGVVAEEYVGDARLEPAAGRAAAKPETLWDLASLTKPLAGAALVLALSEERATGLDDPISRFHDLFKKTRFEGVTLRRLLTHTAGLQAWFPCYVRGEGRGAYWKTLAGLDPQAKPGAAVVYSCLGYLLLAGVVEIASGQDLDRFFAARIARPLGLEADLLFVSSDADRARSAGGERDDATERGMVAARGLRYTGFRNGVVNGEPNDGNAFRRAGGISLNAGLFGTARAVAAAGLAWLRRDALLLREETFEEAVRSGTDGLEEAGGLGWQLSSTPGGSAGSPLSPGSFGHTGFTGASLFVDPVRRCVFVLLSNRLHPDAREVDMNGFRRRFHEAASVL